MLSSEVPGADPQFLDAGYASQTVRELNVYAAADAVLAVSAKEARMIEDLVGADAFAVPDCEELPRSPVAFDDRRGIVFIGNFEHPPNADGLRYLCEQIVPRLDPSLLAQHPIYVVGNHLTESVTEPARGLPSVHVVGWVPSVVPYLERARISVAPLLYGAGTKRKIIQTLMIGTPVVSTRSTCSSRATRVRSPGQSSGS
jgi:glycosyltransferase involved in cell wall biosynthesis